MARLKLNPNNTLDELGQQLLIAASSEYEQLATERGTAEDAIRAMFANDGSFIPDNPAIEFHYDSPNTVHVVVPYVGDKAVRKEAFLPEFDFDKLAAEALGFIVIFGCGK